MIPAEAVEWGTDYWGEVLSEPTEEHARNLARWQKVRLYKRIDGDDWKMVTL